MLIFSRFSTIYNCKQVEHSIGTEARGHKMENFNLSDFMMDFEFDFQNDFTATENHVIDEILTNQIETDGVLENGILENPAAFFEYFCGETGEITDFGAAEQQQQTASIENGMIQAGQAAFTMASCDTDAPVDEQNVGDIDFDWTTFLQDKTPGQLAPANEQAIVAADHQNPSTQDGSLGSANVINDNEFMYHELKTLDVQQIYSRLGETFGLNDLKKLDKCVDFSSLSASKHPTQHESRANNDDVERTLEHRTGPMPKKKVFLMPLQMSQQSIEALQNIAAKLKEHPTVLNSILKKCTKSKDVQTLEMLDRPKRTKQQSEKYLSMHERLERLTIKNITLPTIKPTNIERRPRKQTLKIECDEIPPIQYAMQIVTETINKDGTSNTASVNSDSTTETAMKRSAKPKKHSPKSKPTSKPQENIEAMKMEPMKARRSSKRVQIQ